MASHTNNGSARAQPTTLLTIDDAILLFEPGAQHLLDHLATLTGSTCSTAITAPAPPCPTWPNPPPAQRRAFELFNDRSR